MNLLLGDTVEAALSAVGLTSERVERFVGRECGCPERRDRLNAVSLWARRVLAGKTERAREYLERMVQE